MTLTPPPPCRPAFLILAGLLALSSGGCLAVAAGAAAGGAGLTYVYLHGKVNQAYAASFDDTWAATRTALAELKMPIEEENHDKGTLKTHTADGDTVRIHLETEASRIPADGPLTNVGVRVGALGDDSVSERILHQIDAHLRPAGTVPAQATPTPWSGVDSAPAPPAASPAAPKSTEPPLAEPITKTGGR